MLSNSKQLIILVWKTKMGCRRCRSWWLIVQALKKATSVERKLLIKNFHKDEQEKVQIVLYIYQKLGLKIISEKYEKHNYNEVSLVSYSSNIKWQQRDSKPQPLSS